MVKALADIANSSEKLVKLNPNDIVVDIGSNDGTLLQQYKSKNIIRVGFEPSDLWNTGNNNNMEIIHNYFNKEDFHKRFPNRKAKIITTIAMFYDLEDPNRFVEDIKSCLDSDGIWVIQMNYLGLMLENNTFDNISHEHLEYYSLDALEYLLKKHEFSIGDVKLNDVNGGSFRVYIKHQSSQIRFPKEAKARVDAQRKYESGAGFNNLAVYQEFSKRISNIKGELLEFLDKEAKKRQGDLYLWCFDKGACSTTIRGHR